MQRQPLHDRSAGTERVADRGELLARVERSGSGLPREEEIGELRKKVSAFPKEMETALAKAIKETTERLNLEAKNREELQKREFLGEKNVFTTRVDSLEKMVKEQSEQIAKLTQQLEKAYQQVQDIAVKTIEGSSTIKSFANLQQWIAEQARKSPQEK
jgi:methyl-accepting chemotaxis protein